MAETSNGKVTEYFIFIYFSYVTKMQYADTVHGILHGILPHARQQPQKFRRLFSFDHAHCHSPCAQAQLFHRRPTAAHNGYEAELSLKNLPLSGAEADPNSRQAGGRGQGPTPSLVRSSVTQNPVWR